MHDAMGLPKRLAGLSRIADSIASGRSGKHRWRAKQQKEKE